MSAPDGHVTWEASTCEHGRQTGCVYCPTCGIRYATEVEPRGCLGMLAAPLELIARIYTPTSQTPDLDVTACLEAIRSGDPERTRTSLGFLVELAPAARRIRDTIESLQDHDDRDIALRARDVLAAMDAV